MRALADAVSGRPTPAEMLERAEQWRPWRAYAAQHLWAADAAAQPESKRTKTDDRRAA